MTELQMIAAAMAFNGVLGFIGWIYSARANHLHAKSSDRRAQIEEERHKALTHLNQRNLEIANQESYSELLRQARQTAELEYCAREAIKKAKQPKESE